MSVTTTRPLVEIPQPPPRMILGNVPDMRRKGTAIESLLDVAREYGGIFQLQVPMGRIIVVTDPALAAELCDEERFDKVLGQGLLNIRKRIGDGLFTSYTHEKNWQLAHRILMPTFSHASMKAYVPDMVEMGYALMAHLDGTVGRTTVDIPADMTKLTLDTIALCGFSFRFDSFQRQDQHPFVEAMVEVLTEQQRQVARPTALNKIMIGARRRMEAAAKVMDDTVMEIVKRRRQGGPLEGREDLLEHMLHGVDKVTGESLSDENIKSQCLTFLVAGHETTSGLLSFATYYLMKNPQYAARAQAEVDRVFGTDLSQAPTYEQIHSLHFIEQVLEESLRLWPTAPAFTRGPRAEAGEVIGGQYFIPHGQGVMILLPGVHRSKSTFGPDAEDFNPDHFSPEAKARREANIFLPFGTGARACIGRQFAMQEAKLILGMLLQRFHLVDSENYQLRVKQSLTIKPDGFHLRLRRRSDAERLVNVAPAAPAAAAPVAPPVEKPAVEAAPSLGVTLQVLFGSNLGTCESYAHELAREAGQRGFDARAAALDDVAGGLADGPAVIVCSSYNGTPPDNAGTFCAWLDSPLAPDALKGVKYAVFGCGNREWANTYQKVPRRIDAGLEKHGAVRLLPAGDGDASGDLDGDFRAWKDAFWTALHAGLGLQAAAPAAPAVKTPLYDVEVLEELHPNPFAEVYEAAPMVVVENRELQATEASGRSTRHLELTLPEGVHYAAGDHLGVIPQNGRELVARVAGVFGLTPETRIRLHKRSDAAAALPVDRIVSAGSLLRHYVELQEVATRHQLGILAQYAEVPAERKRLEELAADAELYTAEVKAKSKSLVDLLEEFPSTRLPFGHYLELVSALRPRYYSISSSPLASGRILSVTVGVVDGPARSGHGRYQGACSNYLAQASRGAAIYAFLQDTHGTFRLPASPATPIVMIGAGTGLAPYRGFLQERAALKAQGRTLGKALLFFGCRHPEHDFLYREELEGYAKQGVVDLVTAFSREEATRKVYVQHRLADHADDIWGILEAGGSVYVCGDAAGMSAGVRRALADIVRARTGASEEEAQKRLDELVAENRYLLDVWASN